MATILIIDDDEPVRLVIREILERAGHQVIEAKDGVVGLRVYREQRPDLVTTNILMPEKDGIETIKELKREFPNVKIIAISGADVSGVFGFLSLARELGAERALVKPFHKQEILEAVEELLEET